MNKREKAITGKNIGEEGSTSSILRNRMPSPCFTTGIWGCLKMGHFIRIPITSSRMILAGFFCLNIPVTDVEAV
jgi:hypothetical protein